MKYCTKCVLPETKPHISFNKDGVCSACQAHAKKADHEKGIPWGERHKSFLQLIEYAKQASAPHYDALVPVSGGKDSISQVHRLLGHDLRILAVNVDYGIKTAIGIRNLERIPEMGANLITYRPELKLHKELIRIGFIQYGDPDLLSHTLLHAAPLHLALRFEIPLVLLGENSAFEYGGSEDLAKLDQISRAWFSKFAANNGRDARFISETHDIPFNRLTMYDFPDHIKQSSTRAVFCSSFFRWDSETNLDIAKKYGFETLPASGEGTYRNYVGIDEIINRIHQYFKVLKFGYGRATDHACEDIRNGRLSRSEAIELVKQHDLTPLSQSYIDLFCEFIDITRSTFDSVMDANRNQSIWQQDDKGNWFIPGHLEVA